MRRAIVLYGLSGSGKSTAFKLIKEMVGSSHELTNIVEFPHRFTTRPNRTAEDPSETTVISREQFFKKNAEGFFEIYWERVLPGAWEQAEMYGFSKAFKPISVLSANNALIKNLDVVYKNFKKITKVFIDAPKEICQERIKKRSPEISTIEKSARLSDDVVELKGIADVVMENHTNNFYEFANTVHSIFGQMIKQEIY